MAVLNSEQLERWKDDGYLVVPGFYTPEETSEMLAEAQRLLDDFDPTDHPLTTFNTSPDKHIGDDYFLNSNDKASLSPDLQPTADAQIRYFLETSSLTEPTADAPSRLKVPPAQSVNKIGHALAPLNPVFRRHTLECEKMKDLARELGEHEDPRVLQSMIICKQPRIGGTVPTHNDSTFLYTDPPTAIGAWVALEECTPQNGCLSFLPGSHKKARISTRFVRAEGGGTTFEPVAGVSANDENWDDMNGWVQAPVQPGTLVLIHGSVMHRSPPNPSDKSRVIYTFHMIDGREGVAFDAKNWLQPTKDMPFPSLLT